MIVQDGKVQQCEHCPETCSNHKFGLIRAGQAGWFFSRDGKQAFCPTHVPEWVTAWRARRAAEKAEQA
jgi:hypothetical protein